jgi:hypothetical protein
MPRSASPTSEFMSWKIDRNKCTWSGQQKEVLIVQVPRSPIAYLFVSECDRLDWSSAREKKAHERSIRPSVTVGRFYPQIDSRAIVSGECSSY